MRLLRRAAICFALLSVAFAFGVLYVGGNLPASIPTSTDRFTDVPFGHALEHVSPQRGVDFDALKADRAPLDTFVASLASWSPDNHPEAFAEKDDALAYWLNAYHALVLQSLRDRWPDTRSPGDLFFQRFYWSQSWPIGGHHFTLWSIEKRVRDEFGDARIHFALACGARGCALPDDAPYEGATLDAQLNDAARRFMQSSKNVKLVGHTLTLSPIFRWYRKDLLAAVPEGSSVLQMVWAFLPDSCDERPGCETRGELDKACGAKFDQCTVVYEEMDWSTLGLTDGAARTER